MGFCDSKNAIDLIDGCSAPVLLAFLCRNASSSVGKFSFASIMSGAGGLINSLDGRGNCPRRSGLELGHGVSDVGVELPEQVVRKGLR